LRILVVEDDARNVLLFEAALETEHEVVVERDGIAGQARALAEAFDLILLDIQMPGRSGIEVCRNLRASGVLTPIVALSASVLATEIERTKEAGFVEFWSKPIAPPALRAAVRTLAQRTAPSSVIAGRDPAGGPVRP
jgi:CheY-like chemotaxis protein